MLRMLRGVRGFGMEERGGGIRGVEGERDEKRVLVIVSVIDTAATVAILHPANYCSYVLQLYHTSTIHQASASVVVFND
jgi:hypothetical protein